MPNRRSQQAALEALYRELAPSRDELALNEVEQVLVLASQQLALAGNVQAALAALQLADAKLARLDRPQLVPLRRALARDMDRLKAVPYVDVAGMSLQARPGARRHRCAAARARRAPAAGAGIAAPPADEAALGSRFLREAWAEVKSLVRVEVADRPAAPLVPPPQAVLPAREPAAAPDDGAHRAALARRRRFTADVTAASAWVKQYFDTRVEAGAGAVATLAQLAATPMPAELPDLSRRA